MSREKIKIQAERHAKRGKFLNAAIEYKKLLTGEEKDVSLRNVIGDFYVKANRIDAAVGEFRRAADFYEEKGLYPKSIALYKRIAKLAPKDGPFTNVKALWEAAQKARKKLLA